MDSDEVDEERVYLTKAKEFLSGLQKNSEKILKTRAQNRILKSPHEAAEGTLLQVEQEYMML